MPISSTIKAAVLSTILASAAGIAYAGNTAPASIPNRSDSQYSGQSDLSDFDILTQRTANMRKSPGALYTQFVPINAAFKKFPQGDYPVLYSANPTPELAKIVDNHYAKGEIHLDDIVRSKGGIYAVNGRFIPVMEGRKGDYYVDGHQVLSGQMTTNGMRYVIDGVIANEAEKASIKAPIIIPAEPVTLVVPEQTQIVQEKRVVPGGSSVTTTTIVTPSH